MECQGVLLRATGGRTGTWPSMRGIRGRMAGSYLAGELAGAQAVLHGQRLGHVGHRLVELLQVTFVLHLHGDRANANSHTHYFNELEPLLKR